MKQKIVYAVLLLTGLLFSITSLHAQDERKIVAVINKADWCHVCQANGSRVMTDVIPVFKSSPVQFLVNDLSNDKTKMASGEKLMELKIYDAVKKINSTGLLLLVDANTGKLIDKVSIAEPTEKLIEAIRHSSMVSKM